MSQVSSSRFTVVKPLPCGPIDEAASSIGVGTQTRLRWLKIPEFDAACQFLKILVDQNTPASTRCGRLTARSTVWHDSGAHEGQPTMVRNVSRRLERLGAADDPHS
jgi:hypothetical protein